MALATAEANEQHYEVFRLHAPSLSHSDDALTRACGRPTEFFCLSLGARKKYSCCYWPAGCDSLEEAEEQCLELCAERAKLTDGQDVLDLGCGLRD